MIEKEETSDTENYNSREMSTCKGYIIYIKICILYICFIYIYIYIKFYMSLYRKVMQSMK